MPVTDAVKPLIQSIFYANPDTHPPLINSSRLLVEAGYRVKIFCREEGKHWQISYPAGVQLHRIQTVTDSSWLEYLAFLAKVLRMASREFGLFIGHDMHGFMIAKVVGQALRQRVVYHCHDFVDGSAAKGWGGSSVRKFERRYARTADLVIVPDAERGNIIAKELSLPTQPLIVANGPLARRYVAEEFLRAELARRGKHFSRVIFRPGAIGTGHALEATIASIPHWSNRSWGFVIMGWQHPEYVDKLCRLAVSVGASEQFVVLPPVSYEQVPSFTRGADVGHALYDPIDNTKSYITTASNKIMEYMAAGIPQIVSDRPSLRNFVEKYHCGVIAKEDNPESIACAVNALLSNPERLGRLGSAGRQAFEQEFCYERQFAPALEAFGKLLKRA